jgi:hypothetical protein
MQYRIVGEEDISNRRSIADALEVLRETAALRDDDVATIEVIGVRLPSGERVGSVQVMFKSDAADQTDMVGLPAAEYVRARTHESSSAEPLSIFLLQNARVNGAGAVTLADGRSLRAAEILPAPMPYRPSELDWQIIRYVVDIQNAPATFCRDLAYGLPPELEYAIPRSEAIDCSGLRQLAVPRLKEIAQCFADHGLKSPSLQKIAGALRQFGLSDPGVLSDRSCLIAN